MHPCRQGDEHHQVEVELGGCCQAEEELDGHLVQCAQSVHSARLVQPLLLELTARQVLLVQAAQLEQAQALRVLVVQLALYEQLVQAT